MRCQSINNRSGVEHRLASSLEGSLSPWLRWHLSHQFSIADCEININISLISLIIQVQDTTTDTDVTFACVICGGDGGWVASATFQWSPPHNPRILGESFYQKLK